MLLAFVSSSQVPRLIRPATSKPWQYASRFLKHIIVTNGSRIYHVRSVEGYFQGVILTTINHNTTALHSEKYESYTNVT